MDSIAKLSLLIAIASFSISSWIVFSDSKDKVKNELSVSGGRFVFGMIDSNNDSTFLLDTQSGRIWRLTYDNSGTPLLKMVLFDRLSRVTLENSLEPKARNGQLPQNSENPFDQFDPVVTSPQKEQNPFLKPYEGSSVTDK